MSTPTLTSSVTPTLLNHHHVNLALRVEDHNFDQRETSFAIQAIIESPIAGKVRLVFGYLGFNAYTDSCPPSQPSCNKFFTNEGSSKPPHGFKIGDRLQLVGNPGGSDSALWNAYILEGPVEVLQAGGDSVTVDLPYIRNMNNPLWTQNLGSHARRETAALYYRIEVQKDGGAWQEMYWRDQEFPNNNDLITECAYGSDIPSFGKCLPGYRIYRRNLQHAFLENGTYKYRVKVYDKSVAGFTTGAESSSVVINNSISARYPAPTGLNSTRVATGVQLTWDEIPEEAVRPVLIRIERSLNGVIGWSLVWQGGERDPATIIDTTADVNTAYYYRMTYQTWADKMQNSAPSEPLSLTYVDSGDGNNDGWVDVRDARYYMTQAFNTLGQTYGITEYPIDTWSFSNPPGNVNNLRSKTPYLHGNLGIVLPTINDYPTLKGRSDYSSVERSLGLAWGQYLFWPAFDEKTIYSLWPNGLGREKIHVDSSRRPKSLAIDYSSGWLYYSSLPEVPDGTSRIHKLGFRGGGTSALEYSTLIANVTGVVSWLEVDGDDGFLWWIDSLDNSIHRCNDDGTSESTIVAASGTVRVGLVHDRVNNKLLFMERSTGVLQQCDPDGSNLITVATLAGVTNAHQLAIDYTNSRIFFSSPLQGKIFRCDLDGSNLATIHTGLTNCYGVACDGSRDELWYTDGPTNDQALRRSTLAGASIDLVKDHVILPDSLEYIYQGAERANPPTNVQVSIAGGAATITWSDSSTSGYTHCEVFKSRDVWSTETLIGLVTANTFTDSSYQSGDKYRVRANTKAPQTTSSEWTNPAHSYAVLDQEYANYRDLVFLNLWLASPGTPPGPPVSHVSGEPYLDVNGSSTITTADVTQLEEWLLPRLSQYSAEGAETTTTTTTTLGPNDVSECLNCPEIGWWGDGPPNSFSNVQLYLGSSNLAPNNGVYENALGRFVSTIPPGSTIQSAKLRFVADGDTSGTPIDLIIAAELAPDAASISDYTGAAASAANLTAAQVAWSGLPSWTDGTVYESPELKTIIQEYIDQVGYAEGDHLVMHILDDAVTAFARSRKVKHTNPCVFTQNMRLCVVYTLPPELTTTTTTSTTTTPEPTTTTTTTTLPPGQVSCSNVFVTNFIKVALDVADIVSPIAMTRLQFGYQFIHVRVDPANANIYALMSDADSVDLFRLPFDGSDRTLLSIGVCNWGYPGFDVDVGDDLAFAIGSFDGVLKKVTLSTGAQEVMFSLTAGQYVSLCVDDINDHLFLAVPAAGNTHQIRKYAYDAASSGGFLASYSVPFSLVTGDYFGFRLITCHAESGTIYYSYVTNQSGVLKQVLCKIQTDLTGNEELMDSEYFGSRPCDRKYFIGVDHGRQLAIVRDYGAIPTSEEKLYSRAFGSTEVTTVTVPDSHYIFADSCEGGTPETTTSTTTSSTTTIAPIACNHVWITSPVIGLVRTFYDGSGLVQVEIPDDHFDLEVDQDNSLVYYTKKDTGQVLKIDFTGENQTVLADVTKVYGLAHAAVAGRLYYIENDGGATKKVTRIETDGSGATDILTSGLVNPQFIAVDEDNGWLFITDGETSSGAEDGRLLRYDIDGTNELELDNTGVLPQGVEVDAAGGKVYWCDASLNKIFRVNTDGTSKETLHTTPTSSARPTGLHIDVAADLMWWSEPEAARIRRSALDGGGVLTAFELEPGDQPIGVELCGSWSTTTSTTTPPPETTSTTTTRAPDDAQYLTWTDPRNLQIQKANRDASTIVQVLGPNHFLLKSVTGLIASLKFDRYFFCQTKDKAVYSCLLGGSSLMPVVTSTLSVPMGLALDEVNDRMYVADAGDKKIKSFLLSSPVPAIICSVAEVPLDVVVHHDAGKIYFTAGTKIYQANLDGTVLTELFDLAPTDGSFLYGLDIDRTMDQLYFVVTNGTSSSVRRIDASDGGNLTTLVTGSGPWVKVVIDVVDSLLYWSEPVGRKIGKANLNGTGITTYYTESETGFNWLALLDVPDVTTTTTSTTTTEPPTTSSTTTTEPPTTTTTTSSTTTRPPEPEDPKGREQIVVDQHQGGTSYPFICPSDDLGELFGDLYLAFINEGYTPPFKLKRFKNFQPAATHRFELLITDADNEVVFDTELSDPALYKQYPWSNNKIILEYGNSDGEILRAVIFNGWPAWVTPIEWAQSVEPADGRIDSRVLDPIPNHVQEIVVRQPDGSEVLIPSDTNVVFQAGYNLAIAATNRSNVDGQVFGHQLEFDATPGGGLGRFPGCDDDLNIQSINLVTPDDRGNIRIEFDQTQGRCYRIERPVDDVTAVEGSDTFQQVTVEPNTLMLVNHCTPCCTCDDFLAVYEAIRRLHNRYRQLGIRAEAARDQYRLNIARWEANRACRQKTLLRTAMLPLSGCRLAVAGGLCNNLNLPLNAYRLKLDFTGSTATGCVRCSSVFQRGNTDPTLAIPSSRLRPYQLEGEWPIFYAYFDCTSQGELGYVTFQLEFPGAQDGDTVSLELSVDGQNETGAPLVKETSGLRCSLSDNVTCCEAETTSTTTTVCNTEDGPVSTMSRDTATGQIILTMPSSVANHCLLPGQQITVTGTSYNPYNTTHTVDTVINPRTVLLATSWANDSFNGTWTKV